jgi:hypothetical protein
VCILLILEDPHNDKGLKFIKKFLSYHLSKNRANLILSSFEGTTLKAYKEGWCFCRLPLFM